MSFVDPRKLRMPAPGEALPGRPQPMPVPETHAVNGARLRPPYPEDARVAMFALGCFWGAEKMFWNIPGVIVTAAGYAGGFTPNPTYQEVCTGLTGHAEVVRVVFDPGVVSYGALLKAFWENHDPTQGNRQGADTGTQYRSAIFTYGEEQRREAEASRDAYARELAKAGYGRITTEIREAPEFYFAEDYHQQYLDKVPNGYCPDHGTGVACPAGLGVAAGAVPASAIRFVE